MTDKELLDMMETFPYVEVSSEVGKGRYGVVWRLNDPYSKLTLREKLTVFFLQKKEEV